MLISCSNCHSNYEVDAALIPASGREVKCVSCGNNWIAKPTPDVKVEPAPVVKEAPSAKDVPQEKTPEQKAAEAKAIRVERREKRHQRRAQLAAAKEKELAAAKEKELAAAKEKELAAAKKAKAKVEKEAVSKPAANANAKPEGASIPKIVSKNEVVDSKTINIKTAKTRVEEVKPVEERKVGAKPAASSSEAKLKTNSSILVKAFQKKASASSEEVAVAKAVEELSLKANASKTEKAVSVKSGAERKNATQSKDAAKPVEVKSTASTAMPIEAAPTVESKVQVPKSEPAKVKAVAKTTGAPVVSSKAVIEKPTTNSYEDTTKSHTTFLEREAQSTKADIDEKKQQDVKKTLVDSDVDEYESKQGEAARALVKRETQSDAVPVKPSTGSRFWLGFNFVISFVILMIAVRFMSSLLANAMPFLAPYMDLFNYGFDMAFEYVLGLISSLKSLAGF